MKLYQCAVIWTGEQKEQEKSRLVVPVFELVAETEDQVKIEAARKIVGQYPTEELEIIVRPF